MHFCEVSVHVKKMLIVPSLLSGQGELSIVVLVTFYTSRVVGNGNLFVPLLLHFILAHSFVSLETTLTAI